ncbi:sigma-70 family RNA polymerase sigma factor [Diaminobutyricibacter tongyongensis]|uniref:Sigma-70 family RNA polymerase sigma factor n=1 Tax=Leifsonia tongyongensis TaxID=1268043 RepID=A0A6L9XXI2_9MICO|nr:sigma-70 family RNA polymerase sigma factor [Diaminobutyricibacter tongyongensis]NEN05927.1 sigma-70 family RNA polymerase sigma factor [Diaminobutyricibacter tongyongensis]
MSTVADERITRAQAGDGEAFRELVEPHRRELQVHCYRMLGSVQDAEDALQDTLLTAWQGLSGFEGRSSLRTWLYRIATNRCLNARRAAGRRAAKEWDIPDIEPPEPSRMGEIVWLEPYPDSFLDGVDVPLGPEVHYEQTESISLAFVTALQILPPRQVAVLILRDVLGFRAAEVADMLDASVESVNSALKRARAGLRRDLPDRDGQARMLAAGSPEERALVAEWARAYTSGDVNEVVALLTSDVRLSMPPMALEYLGREAVGRFFGLIMRPGRIYDLVPTRANGQPAFAMYSHSNAGGMRHGTGLVVLEFRNDGVSGITRFDSSVLPSFGLPRSLPS